jgi:aminoglycoside phosphotransferase (APT) family kinase protein
MTRPLSEGSAEDVGAWVAEVLPDRSVTSVRRLGEGLDHVAWLVDDALIVRVAKAGAVAGEQTRREAALLDVVCRVSPVPTPRVVLAAAEEGILVCTFLTGTSLLDTSTPPAPAAAKQLGELLTALHGVPGEMVAQLIEVDDTSPQDWLEEARASWHLVRAMAPPERVAAVGGFLSAAAPGSCRRRVFCHNDLGSEHLLVDAGGELTGVIDWSDAALADPAVDFSRLYRDFGADFALRVRAHYSVAPSDGADDEALERILFYARCSVIEDLAFAHETNDARYRSAAVRAMRGLFVGS